MSRNSQSPSKQKQAYRYSAQDNLETMLDAVNYNNFQIDFIEQEIKRQGKTKPRILDFGAGIGTYADMLEARGYHVDCVEPDASHAKVLKRNKHSVYKDVRQVQGTYDIIYALNVLEHIQDDRGVLEQIGQKLNKKGRVVLFVPAFELIWTGLDDKAEHLRRYSIPSMKRLARNAGFEVESIRYCDPAGFFGALIYRALRKNGTLSPGSVRVFDRIVFPLGRLFEPLLGRILGKNVLAILEQPKKR